MSLVRIFENGLVGGSKEGDKHSTTTTDNPSLEFEVFLFPASPNVYIAEVLTSE